MSNQYPTPSKADIDALVAYLIENATVRQSAVGRDFVGLKLNAEGKTPATFTAPSGVTGRINFAWVGLQDSKAMATRRAERASAAVDAMGEVEAKALLAKLQAKLAHKPTK